MTGRSRLLAAALVSGLAMSAAMGMPVTTAQAADIVEPFVPPPVVAPVVVPTWRGFYLGGFVSGHWADVEACRGRHKKDDDDDDDFFDDDDDDDRRRGCFDIDVDGVLGGVVGGWNFQPGGGSWVFGIEGDWGWGKIEGDDEHRRDFFGLTVRDRVDFEIDQVGHARGRLGWAGWHPNVLLFAAGGAAFAQGDLGRRADIDGLVFADGSDEQWHFGWTIGGGFDWKITPHVVLRAEYLFDTYGSEDYDIKRREFNVDIDHMHTARGAIMWKF